MEKLYEDTTGNRIARLDTAGEVSRLIGLFEVIAADLGWKPGDRLTAYASNSVYFGSFAGDELAGGLQLVVANGLDPMPAAHVWPDADPSSRSDVAHAAIMALRREFRGTPGLFPALTVEMWRFCAAKRVTEIWMEATPPTLRLYRRIGWPLEVIGSLRPHWGEDCYLCRMTTAEVAGHVAVRATRSASHRAMLEAMARPGLPDTDLAARRGTWDNGTEVSPPTSTAGAFPAVA